MLKILSQQKGYKLDFKQANRKELTPLQRKCLDVVNETQKLMEEAVKHEEIKKIESDLIQIISIQAMIPHAMKAKNEILIKMQLKALYDCVNKIDFEKVPKVFLKSFLGYRKKIIERIGRM